MGRVRFFDLILAVAVLAALLFIARHQFPAYEGKAFAPASPQVERTPAAESTSHAESSSQAQNTSSPTPAPTP